MAKDPPTKAHQIRMVVADLRNAGNPDPKPKDILPKLIKRFPTQGWEKDEAKRRNDISVFMSQERTRLAKKAESEGKTGNANGGTDNASAVEILRAARQLIEKTGSKEEAIAFIKEL